MSENIREVVEGDVKVLVKKPGRKELNDSQIVYNKAWRKALDGGAIIRAKLNEYLTEQGVWSDTQQKQYEDFIKQINDRELILKKGGIPLKKAKSIAIELKRLRLEFRDLISERTAYDSNTAEGVADNERFDYLVTACVLDPASKTPVFKNSDDYDERGSEPWAVKAASELANFIYNLDPNYENNLVENSFLKKFNFTDDKGRLVNKDGHLIAIDINGDEKLIDKDGYYVAVSEDGTEYRVDRDGNKIDTIQESPFLDDDGNPITLDSAIEDKPEDSKKSKKKKAESTE